VIVGVVGDRPHPRGGATSAASGAPVSRPTRRPASPGRNWHTALGVNICGEWLSAQPTFEKPADAAEPAAQRRHPTTPRRRPDPHPTRSWSPRRAATPRSASSPTTPDGACRRTRSTRGPGPSRRPKQTSWSNGDTCTFGDFKGQKGELVWAVDGKTQTGQPVRLPPEGRPDDRDRLLAEGPPTSRSPPNALQRLSPPFSDQERSRGGEQGLAVVVTRATPGTVPSDSTTTNRAGRVTRPVRRRP